MILATLVLLLVTHNSLHTTTCAFLVPALLSSNHRTRRPLSLLHRSYYRDDFSSGGGGGASSSRNRTDYDSNHDLSLPPRPQDTPPSSSSSSTTNNTPQQRRSQHVPLLGPIPNAPPLLVGSEMFLDPPTESQWQSLQESVVLHSQYNRMNDDDESSVTGIKAAPLVLMMDEVTGIGSDDGIVGRYATLAAVVGISSSRTSLDDRLNDRFNPKYTDDEVSFMDSFSTHAKSNNNERSPSESCIRLVGVGRAQLRDYFYKQSSSQQEQQQRQQQDPELSQDPPIAMAEFDVLFDDLHTTSSSSPHAASIHALHTMSSITHQLLHLHEERRRLVRGCQAATVRLQHRDFFEDSDGIGEITNHHQELLKEFVAEFEEATTMNKNNNKDRLDPSMLHSMDNFGLNVYSFLSPLMDLTDVAMQQLEPYYSPQVRQDEEFRMMLTSFVAFRALVGWCSATDMAWALKCNNTIERLTRAHQIMSQHTAVLKRMAERLSQDLRDCGEECSDLW